MNHKSASIQLKVIIIAMAIFGLMVYTWIVPTLGTNMATIFPECAYAYWPWLIFIWATGIPCFAALVYAWRIASRIGSDNSFCKENGLFMKRISQLAIFDGVFFFLGNIVLLFANINHPSIVIVSLFVTCVAMAFAVAAKALSHLIMEAAELQEQSDYTI